MSARLFPQLLILLSLGLAKDRTAHPQQTVHMIGIHLSDCPIHRRGREKEGEVLRANKWLTG